jgi:hypothetical protein
MFHSLFVRFYSLGHMDCERSPNPTIDYDCFSICCGARPVPMCLPQANGNATGKPDFALKVSPARLDPRTEPQGLLLGLGDLVAMSAVVVRLRTWGFNGEL